MNNLLHTIKNIRTQHLLLRIQDWVMKPKTITQSKPIILNDENVCSNPIFIIGIHRSGTSLLRRIINSHSNIACPPETFFMSYFCEMLHDKKTHEGLRGFGYLPGETNHQLRLWASRYHEAFRISEGKRRWADKTPEYVDYAEQLFELYGEKSQYVLLTRHPFDIVYSLYERGWNLITLHKDPLLNYITYVKRQLSKMKAFAKQYVDNTYLIRYEEMVVEPEKALSPLFEWLGESWENEVLSFHKKDHNYGTEDPIARRAKCFNPSLNNWKKLPEAQQKILLSHQEDLLSFFGYQL